VGLDFGFGDVPGPRRDLVGYGSRPPKAYWPEGAAVALNLIVAYEEGSEYSKPAGDTRNEGQGELDYRMDDAYRDLGVESTYEYGSRAGVWRLLRLLEEYGVRSTFFAAAVALELNPAVGEAIRAGGHEPCAHGWRWDEPWLVKSKDREREEIAAAVASIRRTCGERPVGWYSRYSASPWTRELLVEEGGFLYDADAVNDDLPYFVEVGGKRHLVVPYTYTVNDGRIIAAGKMGLPDFLDHVRRHVDELRREAAAGYPKMMSIGLHARWMGQPARTSVVREVIEHVLSLGDVWIARRDEIARWWLDHEAEFAS
jgi:peptidoglycan/xylan/chitin deacetylase (PgdA/CDA1 family)